MARRGSTGVRTPGSAARCPAGPPGRRSPRPGTPGPTRSMSTCCTMRSLRPLTNDSRAPGLLNPSVSVLPSTPDDLGVLAELDPGHAASGLHAVDDLRPEAAHVDQGQTTRRAGASAAVGCPVAAGAAGAAAAGVAAAGGSVAAGRAGLVRCSAAGAVGAAGRGGCSACGSGRVAGRATGSGARGGRGRGGRCGGRRRVASRVPSPSASRAGRCGPPRPRSRSSAPGQQQPGAQQLEQQPRRGGALELGQRLGHHVGGPGQVVAAEPGGLGDQPLRLVLRDVDEPGGGGVGDRADDQQVAEPLQQVLGEPARVLSGLDHLVDHAEDRRRRRGRRRRRRRRRAGSRG